jgi:outer membrane protein assembly factor BamA
MKYLKGYKIFDNNDYDLKDDIKDLLIDLEDQEFNVDVEHFGKIQVNIYKEEKGRRHIDPLGNSTGDLFNYKDIEYYIDRLTKYLKDYGYEKYVPDENYDEKKINTRVLMDPRTFTPVIRSSFLIKFISK